MSAKKRAGGKGQRNTVIQTGRSPSWVLICLGCAALGLAVLAILPGSSRSPVGKTIAPSRAPESASSSGARAAPPPAGDTRQKLIGRWVRPDGGYVLKIKQVAADGQLDAVYLNPSSIHVSQATVKQEDQQLKVFVELRDVNYPGSTYNLTWDSNQDQLVGDYYQAVYGETIPVSFVREE